MRTAPCFAAVCRDVSDHSGGGTREPNAAEAEGRHFSQVELTHGGDRQVDWAGADENHESHPDVSEMHLSGSLLTAPERHTGDMMPFLEFGRWPARVTGNFR